MKLPLLLLAALAAGAAAAPAADSPSEPAAKYELKNRSFFNLDESTRPPFWPIGWVKRTGAGKAVEPETAPKYEFKEEGFIVSSILTGNPPLAVINGRSYSEGEFVRMPKKGPPARVRVLRIYDGFVQLQAENQVISPKLRRETLTPKQTSGELLLDDEE